MPRNFTVSILTDNEKTFECFAANADEVSLVKL